MLGVVSILLMWIFGPKVIDVVSVDMENGFVSIMAVIISSGTMIGKLHNDGADQQMIYLQTLPVRNNQIVHAKFLSVLFQWG